MAITITKSGPFYGTAGTPISFSSLRTNFRATDIDGTVSVDISPISASQLRRIVSQSNSDPTVPDATENVQISTGNDLSISQFRNSVKYYRVSQTSTNTNLNISSQTWNSNLSKNIKKKVSIVGTIGSSDTNIPALLTTSGQHCNLEIAVTGTGKVIGAGGTAGTANGGNGGNGGTAMNLLNTLAASVIKVTVASGANIYGGGGGGGAGTLGGTGGTGANGSYQVNNPTSQYQELSAGTKCSNQKHLEYFATFCANAGYSGYRTVGRSGDGSCGPGHSNNDGYCTRTVSVDNYSTVDTTGGVGGPGGNGANGGVGAGYEQALGAAGSGVVAVTDWTGRIGGTNAGIGGKGGKGGDSGAGGTFGANGSPGTQGDPGDPGGNGSLVDGTVTTGGSGTAGGLPFGTAGDAGRAIAGSNYSVTGTISGDTVKGLYNP